MLEMNCQMVYSYFLVYILQLQNVESIVKFWSVPSYYTFMKGPPLEGKHTLILVFAKKEPMLIQRSESLVLWNLKLLIADKEHLKKKKKSELN